MERIDPKHAGPFNKAATTFSSVFCIVHKALFTAFLVSTKIRVSFQCFSLICIQKFSLSFMLLLLFRIYSVPAEFLISISCNYCHKFRLLCSIRACVRARESNPSFHHARVSLLHSFVVWYCLHQPKQPRTRNLNTVSKNYCVLPIVCFSLCVFYCVRHNSRSCRLFHF